MPSGSIWSRTALSALALCMGFAGPASAECSIDVGGAKCVDITRSAKDARPISQARFVDPHDRRGEVTEVRARFKKAPAPPPPRFSSGDVLPEDVMVLINRHRYGLPAPRDGWTYFRAGDDIYRADLHTREVIDRVNDHLALHR